MGQSSKSTPLPTLSFESEKKRRDDKEVFGSILSNMEKEGGLLEAGVVNQPLPSKEEIEEASRISALEILDPKETANAESYEAPIRVALEEAVAEKQLEVAEEKKKKRKIKEKRDKGDEKAHPIKKKERRMDEKMERRREKMRLKNEEERRKRAEIPKLDGESTSVRGDKGESAKLRESAQPEEETM
ncbi:nucleolar protein 58-like [Benincasa hispida]|uniref:nucleolar protein 58-like n=1 Tax=Benincasa hispida TaxID=102211 RepID=UPI0018FFBCDF|nr:nucleolar protein 58-like [Benincasa hispida]